MATKNVIAELLVEIGLDTKDAEKSAARISKQLDKVEKSGEGAAKGAKKAKVSLGALNKEFDLVGKFAGAAKTAIFGVAGVLQGLGVAVIGTGASFEKLRAQLKTATGSAQGAEKALAFIKDFAKNTPFQVGTITEAFVKLTNLGLEPSERALTSYGDTASAMGKSLDQMVEAVADATTGEFERLKEFGIKSKSEGDRVTFTFRGVATEVGKNTEEINEFLIGLGENNFAGAMADQMGTLGGIMSNLKDAFTEFLLTVAESGPLEEFKGLVMDLRDATGDKEGLAKTLARTLVRAIKALRRALRGDLINTLKSAAEALAFVVENFDKLIFLFGAAKTFQAFNAIAVGFRSMGIAAGGALGPIGAIAAALIAIIPIAIDAGNAIGDALARDRNVTRGKRGGVVDGVGLGAQQEQRGIILSGASDDLLTAEKRLARAEASGNRISIKLAREDVLGKESILRREQKIAAKQAKERAKVLKDTAAGDEAESAEFGGFDADVAALAESLGIGGEDGSNTAKQQRALDKAVQVLAEGGSREDAKKAAGLKTKRKGGGGRGRKAKKEEAKKAITSPTTVSEFFTASARGELGALAARTPSTGEIEPTVAIDITNNTFTFSDTFNIKGVSDPVEAGKQVILQIKAEFDRRLGNAGQQMASNVVR